MSTEPVKYLIGTFNHGASCSKLVNNISSVVEKKVKSNQRSTIFNVNRTDTVYSVNTDQCEDRFIGRAIDNESIKTDDGCSWWVVTRKKNSGKVSVRSSKFVIFQPNNVINDDNKEHTTLVDRSVAMDIRNQLTLQYGSKMKKRALEAKMSNIVDHDSLNKMVTKAMSEMKPSTADETLNASMLDADGSLLGTPGTPGINPFSALLPPFNKDAETPSQVYNLDDIVNNDELSILKIAAESKVKLSSDQLREKGINNVIVDLMMDLPLDKRARILRCSYLLYADCLCKLVVQKGRFGAEKFGAILCAQELVGPLLEKFAEKQEKSIAGSIYRVVATGKDKANAYLTVLMLHFFNFELPLSNVIRATDVTESKLLKICHALGCQVKKSPITGDRIAVLKSAPKRTDVQKNGNRKRRTN